jgi:hypothetical protein
VFDVEVTIANKDGQLRPGMIGTVAVARATADATPLLAVPLTAIVKPTAGGRYAVLVVERQGSADVARVKTVELGQVMGNGIAVLKGLAAGDRVVVSGANLLVDGEAVRVVE